MSRSGATRALLLAALVPLSLGGQIVYPDTARAVLLLVVAAVVLAAALLVPDQPLSPRWESLTPLLPLLLVGLGLVATAGRLIQTLAVPVVLAGALVVGALVLAGGRDGWPGRLATLAAVAVLAAAYAVVLARRDSGIDVLVFQHDGAAQLLHGGNPWSMTFPNVYAGSPRLSRTFYGPEALSADGLRTSFGFPYPPVTLLTAVPGYVLGDVRLTHLIALAATALVLRAGARDRTGRWLAPLVLMLPATPVMLMNGWTEPVVAALLAGLAVALARRPGAIRTAAYLLGALLVAKQYTVVTVPLLWLLRDRLRERAFLIRALAAAVLLTVPWWVWDPAGFWHSVVTLQFLQPFRGDSTSLLVWSVAQFGWPPASVYGVLPLAAGLLTAVVLARRAPATPAGYAASLGLTLLVTVLLSKQAFTNYYFLITAAVVIAAVAWPAVPDPEPAGDPGPGRNLSATSAVVPSGQIGRNTAGGDPHPVRDP